MNQLEASFNVIHSVITYQSNILGFVEKCLSSPRCDALSARNKITPEIDFVEKCLSSPRCDALKQSARNKITTEIDSVQF